MIGAEHLRRQMQDPFFKYFKQVPGPDGRVFFRRRFSSGPSGNLKDPGVTREAADIYKQRTGQAYGGPLIMPESADPTFAKSSYAPKSTVKPAARAAAAPRQRPLRTQRSLFGGDVKTLYPSQRRDLTRRRAARRQAEKTKKVLGT